MTKTTVPKLRREHLKRLLNISMKQWNQQPILEIMPGLGQCLLIMHTVKILLLEHSNGTKIIKISSLIIFRRYFHRCYSTWFYPDIDFCYKYMYTVMRNLKFFYKINEKNLKKQWPLMALVSEIVTNKWWWPQFSRHVTNFCNYFSIGIDLFYEIMIEQDLFQKLIPWKAVFELLRHRFSNFDFFLLPTRLWIRMVYWSQLWLFQIFQLD